MSRVITDGVPIPFREVLLQRAKDALDVHDRDWEKDFADYKVRQCDRYFRELWIQHTTIAANRESQHITMARLALDKGAPFGERQAAANAFFKFARKHNMTAEAIVSITHPPEPTISAAEFFEQAQRQRQEAQQQEEDERLRRQAIFQQWKERCDQERKDRKTAILVALIWLIAGSLFSPHS